MPRNSTEFILNSLKGRIWLAAGATVVFNCVCGLLAYLGISFALTNPIYLVISAFLLASGAAAAFGWWLSKEVLQPIEKLSRLVQSLERSPNISLPKTTGASETDELLLFVHRNSQQLQNLISMMDDVAAGKTQTAMAPLQNADRLSASFQKLVSKVTDSIDAKRQLVVLQNAVGRLSKEAATIRSGRLDVSVSSEVPETREIAEAFKYLLTRTTELVSQMKAAAHVAGATTGEIKDALRTAIQEDEAKTAKLKRAAALLREIPERVESVEREISDAGADVERSITEVARQARLLSGQSAAFDQLRRELTDVAKALQKVRDSVSNFPRTAKSADELARRCKLVSLNTSIGTSGSNGKNGSAILAEEVGSISTRAESIFTDLNAHIDLLLRGTTDVETTIRSAVSRCSEAARNAAGESDLEEELESCMSRTKKLVAKAAELSSRNAEIEGSADFDEVREGAVSAILAESERKALQLLRLAGDLSDSIRGFRSAGVAVVAHDTTAQHKLSDVPATVQPTGYGPVVRKA